MSLQTEDFERLWSHWAIKALGTNDKHVSAAVHKRLAQHAVGRQIAFDFPPTEEDMPALDRVDLAYEIAAVEGLDELSRPGGERDHLRKQAMAASFRAFDLRRLMSVPHATHERLHFVLHLSALAYCGDRWADLRRWYTENKQALTPPSVVDVPWDQRLLFRLFHCWIRLFRKNGWDDLDRIRETISGLRDDQKTMEARHFQNGSQALDRVMALRLAALYHWAKATETLAHFMLQGEPTDPFVQIDQHFDTAVSAAMASTDPQLEILLRWLHAAARIMVTNSLWWSIRTTGSKTGAFVRALTHRQHRAMFELLPPQRAALLEQNLLDQAKTAIVVDLPTSGGKTLIAQFRILQALNQFDADNGWVAYVVPTRALAAQITRRLRQDFNPIHIRVEQLSGAVEVDAFEDRMLTEEEAPFHVLVATPEKLSLVIRNRKIQRPLALVVMDEAQNLENSNRGLRIEFLLATIKRDCPKANFLLLMPYVEDPETIARWLAQDINAGQAISLGTTPWKPNERIVGIYHAQGDTSKTAGWHLAYETLTTSPKAMPLAGTHRVGDVKPIDVPKSKVLIKNEQQGLGLQTAAMSAVMSVRGTSIAIANSIRTVWSMADHVAQSLEVLEPMPDEIRLVQDFLSTEIGPSFPLIDMLNHGVGVHHAGLSDDARALMEWLADMGRLRVLCATSTITQGINFPVSSIFLQSRFVSDNRKSVEISPREFWNLAGRAGRVEHDSVGVVGLAQGTDREAVKQFVSRQTGALVSRLVTLLDELEEHGSLANLDEVLWQDQWEDFRCYIAHLWAEKQSLDAVLAESEQLLRQTYGYTTLRNNAASRSKADALLAATRSYARRLAGLRPGTITLADATGFSPEGVQAALTGMRNLEDKLTPTDWMPESLFGDAGSMAALFGVMLKVPQLKEQLEDIGGQGTDGRRISDIARDWINGVGLGEIATTYFSREKDPDGTAALSDACRAIYRAIVNSGTWGLSALSRMSGFDFDALSEDQRKGIDSLPAMIYHGVRSEHAVLMRMNSVPRSAAESLGLLYRELAGDDETRFSVGEAREFLKGLSVEGWEQARPQDSNLSGSDYKHIWGVLSGEPQ